eukprot:gb/GEZN01004870.1/.p1 GENE.gb/GEZN01004870.1/~~gb/GEZN01004870.1/.p1  ORF type:complete len:445 (-),score=57.97 gb/GEZN01004870.1/:420-1754(-)
MDQEEVGYHLHSRWTGLGVGVVTGSGPDCSIEHTGNHWDPTLACGPYSDSPECKHNGGCVSPSSSYWKGWAPQEILYSVKDVFYLCNKEFYELDSFCCEVGDLSGKNGGVVQVFSGVASDFFHDPYLYIPQKALDAGLSVVVSGRGGQRLLCGRLEKVESSDYTGPPDKPWSIVKEVHARVADFAIVGFLTDQVIVMVDPVKLNNSNFSIPNECLTGPISYHIHDKWTYLDSDPFHLFGIGAECASQFTGGHYDPTLACSPQSGSPFCKQPNCARLTTSQYNCQIKTDVYSCEVGDLSGKHGLLRLTDAQGDFTKIYQRFADPYLPLLNILAYKSVVFHCPGAASAFCAVISPVLDPADSIMDSEFPFGYDESDHSKEIAVTVGVAVALSCLCAYHYGWRCRNVEANGSDVDGEPYMPLPPGSAASSSSYPARPTISVPEGRSR